MKDRIQLRRHRAPSVLRTVALLFLTLCAAPTLAPAAAQTGTDPMVTQIRVKVPAQPRFVVRATMPVPRSTSRARR